MFPLMTRSDCPQLQPCSTYFCKSKAKKPSELLLEQLPQTAIHIPCTGESSSAGL